VTTGQIYWGAVPFVLIQIIMVGLIIAVPALVGGGMVKKAAVDPTDGNHGARRGCRVWRQGPERAGRRAGARTPRGQTADTPFGAEDVAKDGADKAAAAKSDAAAPAAK